MARYTSAYSGFVDRLGEIETVRKLAALKERKDPVGLRNEINALTRGTIVLLCGHLEAYIKELGEIALESMITKNVPRAQLSSRLYYYISQDLIQEIRDTPDPEKVAIKFFAFIDRDISYWSKNGPFSQPISADRFNNGFASPAFKKINKYFNRFGYSDYQTDLANRLQGNYHSTKTMVNHLVNTRNKIAHGDPTTCETPGDVKQMISIIRLFCGSTDAVFATWWADSFCTIR